MRPNVLAQMMLCCAAVLFLPQALECCAHSSTVLEALASESPRMTGTSHHMTGGHTSHATIEHEERVIEHLNALASGADPDEFSRESSLPNLSLPSGHELGQSPSMGALNMRNFRSVELGWRPVTVAQSNDSATGRSDSPETPPPQSAN